MLRDYMEWMWAKARALEGGKNAAITQATLKVYRTFLDLVDVRTGACIVAVSYIAAKANRSVRSVYRAIEQLEAVGLMQRVRRLKRTIDEAGREITVQDISGYLFEYVEVAAVRAARFVLRAKKAAAKAAVAGMAAVSRAACVRPRCHNGIDPVARSANNKKTGEKPPSNYRPQTLEERIAARCALARERKAERLRREESSCDDAVLATARGSGFQ